MSMHLCGPALTTTGKKKGKKKWPSAEAKRQAEQLENDWQDLKKRHNAEQHEKKRVRAITAPTWTEPSRTYRGANDPKPKSLNTWVTGAVASKPSPQYSGDKILGIGTLHKSNAVPVFSNEEAIDISRMRRG
jgi:hypothetical protein